MKGIGNLNQISASTKEKTFQVKLREQKADTRRRTGQKCPAVLRALARAHAFFDAGESSHGEQSWRRGVLVLPCALWSSQA